VCTARGDLSKGKASPTLGNEALGSAEDKLLAQRPQGARVMHGEDGNLRCEGSAEPQIGKRGINSLGAICG
jgi:hypothetical protein